MKEYTRRAIAYIIYRIITGNEIFQIYDYSLSRKFQYTGKVTLSSVSIFDPEQKSSITGSEKASLYILHRDNEKYIDFTIRENNFQGYDYESHKPFSGMLKGNLISIYDPEYSRSFDYSL
ncbi:MAG TPA: hypothetical protein DHV62_04600 [Elusimicrobia bacterium]|jgi:hypothetical protein|nr:hypothetical protein [Elusimicrobiota bacterium]